jgi:putative ABC transport system substrate-binding protein
MRRREFITLLGGAAAWPLAARAQQSLGMRRIGVLMTLAEIDPEAQSWLAAFTQELSQLGWTEGRNLRMEVRWAPGSIDLMRTAAKELVGLQPDVILSNSTPATASFARETRTIPIVFAIVSDPVGSGFVASLPARAATSQALASFKRQWRASGLSCSRRSHLVSNGPR